MATLYVENVPEDLHDALKERAKANRRSLAAEVLVLLEQNVPTAKELKARKALYRSALRLRSQKPLKPGPFPSSEEMQREDRAR